MRGTELFERYGSGFMDYFYEHLTVNHRADGKWSVFLYVEGFDELGRERTTLHHSAAGLRGMPRVVSSILQILERRCVSADAIKRDELLRNADEVFGVDAEKFMSEWDRQTTEAQSSQT